MSGGVTKRPAIAWPLTLTCWCFAAAAFAGKAGGTVIVILAVIQTLCAWGIWLLSEPREDS